MLRSGPPKRYKIVNLHLTSEQIDALRDISGAYGVSINAVVRRMLDRGIAAANKKGRNNAAA